MEARFLPLVVAVALASSLGAGYRTSNFIVEAPTPQLAEEIGKAAEQYRHDLAITWTGAAMPNWSHPCPIRAEVEPNLGAGGATSFVFDKGEVFGWDMKIQGSQERVLDSVLPHEVTHTIFASYFRRPLPRWADEGACTTVEHVSERGKQQTMLINFLHTGRGIPFDEMFAMKEYPADVLPLYSQGYSLARFLIEQKGRREFVDFVGEGMKSDNWAADLKKHYGYSDLKNLQGQWLAWVKVGSPAQKQSPTQLASAAHEQSGGDSPLYRAQNNDGDSNVAAAKGMLVSATRGGFAANGGAAENSWASVDSAKPTGEKSSAGAASSGWYASQASAANAPTSGGGSHPSVYDRKPQGTLSQGEAPQAKPAPPTNTDPSTSAPPAREPQYLAQRDITAPVSADHRVLMEWNKPE